MEAGWGRAFLDRFNRGENDDQIATILTRDNREFLARRGEIEVLDTFPTAWIVNFSVVVPESEIVRVDVTGRLPSGDADAG